MVQSDGEPVIGWDIGGAHLKAALVDGSVKAAAQVPCELWRGLAALDASLAALPDWARMQGRHAVTMTGELCDVFPDRATGVVELTGWAQDNLAGAVAIYGGRAGFVAADAANHAPDIASANWHATAALVGRLAGDALLVDIGSTTADLIPVANGSPAAVGYTDAERLATSELVYTGLVRTPVLSLADSLPFAGETVAVMAETFATMADVYRLLGALPKDADQQDTADGRGKSLGETRVRLARMIGRDAAQAPPEAWRVLAAHIAELQLRRLHDAAARIDSRGVLAANAPLVGCGVGRAIVHRLAARVERPYTDLAGLVACDREAAAWASWCAPAVAVALLALDQPSACFEANNAGFARHCR